MVGLLDALYSYNCSIFLCLRRLEQASRPPDKGSHLENQRYPRAEVPHSLIKAWASLPLQAQWGQRALFYFFSSLQLRH